MRFSYAYILDKYFPHARVVIEDRTYEGIVWYGLGEKPSEETLNALVKEEERFAQIEINKTNTQDSILLDRQRGQREQAKQDAKPLAQKIQDQYKQIYAEIEALTIEAQELQCLMEARSKLEAAWFEVSKTEAKCNDEAKAYLAETDWYYTREAETKIKVPDEVVEKRAKARESITRGDWVHMNWQELRAKERPSRAEIMNAIRLGGDELKRIKGLCQDISFKYAKPKKI